MLVDGFNRIITYMRISVTDRCNYRCTYCMPEDGIQLKPHDEILRYEQIVRIAEEAVKLGIRKIRPAGSGLMSFKAFVNGWHVQPGDRLTKIEE